MTTVWPPELMTYTEPASLLPTGSGNAAAYWAAEGDGSLGSGRCRPVVVRSNHRVAGAEEVEARILNGAGHAESAERRPDDADQHAQGGAPKAAEANIRL